MSTYFKNGFKFVDERRIEPLIGVDYPSKTSSAQYRTIFWADGTTSCNCRGWATHKRCRHCDDVRREVLAGRFGAAARDLVTLADQRRALPASELLEQFVGRGMAAQRELERLIPKSDAKETHAPDEPIPFRRIRL